MLNVVRQKLMERKFKFYNSIIHWLFSVQADNPTQEMTPAEMMRALQKAEADRKKMKREMEELR